ncbi:Na/Pi symporter [Candidatus Chloroploca sp. M-50]|uniref:Na/Pi symporter n=1 Tax=Candidatus Chloroploca mongolica TaxID=2528176 RepID=A0ABS4D676_9CHLR|nr:Na/Pi symporter [Candidatus Chloroploca mongolica]MBP1464937.1 Na/Pi symporter [Candidatus Chloroploca mongolica]
MATSADSVAEETVVTTGNKVLHWLLVVALVYLLIVAVGVISSGFRAAVGDQAAELFAFANNPVVGLIVGIVATALIQSSSTATAIIVGLVGGGLPVAVAVPMVMGANIGTALTSGIVSLSYMRNKEEFNRAFSASTVKDLFNLLAVLIFFPLEVLFQPLERLGAAVAQLMVGGADLSIDEFDFVGMITRPLRNLIRDATSFLPEPFNGILQIIIGVALILVAVHFMSILLKQLLVGRAKEILHTALGRGAVASIVAGTIVTILVQSSTATTSLMVPLAGSGAFGLSVIYPFTVGANIGTTVTGLLAATAVSGPQAVPAMTIALVHLFFNLFGTLIIFGIPFLRDLPVVGSERLGAAASERPWVAFAYLGGVFFALPLLLLGLSMLF